MNQRNTSSNKPSTKRRGFSASAFSAAATILLLLHPNTNVSAFAPPSKSIQLKISKKQSPTHDNRHTSHKLSMLSLPTTSTIATTLPKAAFTPPLLTNLSALTATITGGIFAGSLHAIAGPDHLAALLPRCCGLPWFRAARIGAVWGLGHGVSATLLGMVGFALKRGVSLFGLGGTGGNGSNFDMLHHAGSFMELAIGISLIVIGLVGIKEAREWSSSEMEVEKVEQQSLSSDGTASLAASPPTAKSAVLLNGILHGFSWDGAPSLAPAVAIATWRGSLTFLVSYALGTMAAMTLATTVIGEGTRRASKKLDRPDLPRDLSVGSSFLALLVGVVWCFLALR